MPIQIAFVIKTTTSMGKGDHCAVYGCNNDRRYPEKQKILSHVGVLRFYSPLSKKDKLMWEKLINRKDFKMTMSTKVCSNHFSLGYRCKESCRSPTLYMKGYEEKPGSGNRRPAPKVRSAIKLNAERKRKTDDEIDSRPIKRQALASDSDSEETFGKEAFPSFQEELQSELKHSPDRVIHAESQDKETQTEMTSTNLTKRDLFLDQVTCPKHCYWYTGLTRVKLDLIYHFVEEKAKSLKYWKGSVDTPRPT